MSTEKGKNAIFVYRLTFGPRITDPQTEMKELSLDQGVRQEFSDNEHEYYLTLHGVKINRKIYQPVEIEAELEFIDKAAELGSGLTTAPSFNDVSALLLKRLVTVEIYEVDPTVSPDNLKPETLATNCYVYEMDHLLRNDLNGMRMYVKLNIFSMDKLMTLNKYSKAYVARKLGSGILQPESLLFGTWKEGYPLIQSNVDNLQFLRYTAGKEEREFIQPYLVQYNESFYDFLVRTSNRCGEFLYFEDGQLTLGLPDDGEPVSIDSFESVSMQSIAEDPMTISFYNRDSMKDGTGDVKSLNQTVIKKQQTGFPEEAFPKNIVSNSELATDEYIFPLFKDKFTSLPREMFYYGDGEDIAMFQAMKAGKTIFSNTLDAVGGVAASLAVATIVDHGIQTYLSNNQTDTVNLDKNKRYLDPYKDKKEQSDGNKAVAFSTVTDAGWTTLDYYNRIYKNEVAQQRQIVCINMGTNFIPVKLGQKISINGKGSYVIIQIQQTSEETWNRDYEKYDTESRDKYAGMRSQKIYAIPSYMDEKKECFIPPVQPVSVIRKTGPQTAFVTDNEDPKFQGRVRIAYPWQSEGSGMKNELKEAEQKLQAAEMNTEKLKARKEDLLKLQTALKIDVEELKKYVNATPEEREEMLSNKRKLSSKLAEEIAKLEAEKIPCQEELDRLQAKLEKDNQDEAWIIQLETIIQNYNNEIASKQGEKKHAEGMMADMIAAAKEHDERSRRDFEYKDIGKDNSVIWKVRTNNSIQKEYREVLSQLRNAEEEKKKVEDYCKQKAEAIKEKIIDMSTPWVRVATPMATPGGGAFFRPRVGDEVLINYDCDNVERPYVVGSLFSKNTLTPDERYYRKQSPELQWKNVSMAISSPNGHHISFTDPEYGGSFITNLISPGLGFYGSIFGYNNIAKDGKDLAGGIHIGDRYGLYEIEMKSHKRAIDIKSPFGTVNINAFTGITISAPNGDVKIQGKNITLDAGNKVTINSGNNLPTPSCGDAPTGKTKTSDITKLIIEGVGAAVTDQFVSSIVDLSTVRHVIEVFVRPVDGTMLLKSRKFLKLEAGLGNATIKRDLYKSKSTDILKEEQEFYKELCGRVQEINDDINIYLDSYNALKKKFLNCRHNYHLVMEQALKPDSKMPCISKLAMNDSKNNARKPSYSIDSYVNDFKDKFKLKGVEYEDDEKKFKAVLPTIEDYYQASKQFFELCNGVQLSVNMSHHGGDYEWLGSAYFKTATEGWGKKYFDEWHNKCDEIFESEAVKAINDDIDPLGGPHQIYFRRAFLLVYLKNVYDDPKNAGGKYIYIGYNVDKVTNPKVVDITVDYWWKRQIKAMDRWSQNSLWRSIWDGTIQKFWTALYDNSVGLFKKETDREVWDSNLDGQILFSDKEDSTLSFEGEGLHKETDANHGTMNHLKWILRDM